MTVVRFPKRLPAAVVSQLSGYDRAAHRKGIQTVTIETELAVREVNERLKAILHLAELQVFGRLNNPLSMYFAFSTSKPVDEIRAEVIAIRQALADAGIAGMAFEQKESDDE